MMMGALSSDAGETGTRKTEKQSDARLDPTRGFEWSERVRDLSARMRYFEAALGDDALTSVEKEWLVKLLQQIYNSHDPKEAAHLHDGVWRVWVRLELWQAAEHLATSFQSKAGRKIWHQRAARMRRSLCLSSLSPMLRSQMRVAIKALRENL